MFLPAARRFQLAALLGSALLLGSLAPVAAQAPNGLGALYPRPRYPGGPNSLRAALQRLARVPGAPAAGELFIQLQLDEAGHLRDLMPLTAPRSPQAVRLTKAQARALDAALAKWPTWQLASPQPEASPPTITLPVSFGPTASSTALPYADVPPVFSASSLGLNASQPAGGLELVTFLQRQVRYPADDLRMQRQGDAYGYFEVSETGVIEQRRIVGSLSPTIDAEVLRVLQLLPDAQAPARSQGRPVRIFCLVPIRLRIQ